MDSPGIPKWTVAAPVAGWLLLGGVAWGIGGSFLLVVAAGLVACVLAAVHHAELVAHRVGEPYGTFILAVAVTVIEVALIVSLMLAAGPAGSAIARDAVFAAVMIILTGMIGICMLVGASHHHEQAFGLHGVSGALVTLTAISVLTMVLPNYTLATPGPYYSGTQLGFIALVTLVLYITFAIVQTVRHRDYFLPPAGTADEEAHAPPPSNQVAWTSFGLLVVCLAAVVLLGKSLAPALEAALARAGAPPAVLGIIIAALVLTPESLAAVRAARANRLQTSLNLALGSALACVGLTVPAVAVLSLAFGWPLALGLDAKSTVLLVLSLFLSTISLSTGRTTILQGVVHLVLFAVYLGITIVP